MVNFNLMTVTAKLRYLNIAPRKVRLVSDLIRGKKVVEAQTILDFTQKRGALPLLKLLKQAIANAKNNFQLAEDNLYISKILVNEGSKLKRIRPQARGQASEIQKKTSHITLFLEEIEKQPKKIKKVKPTVIEKVKEKIVKPEKPKFKPEIKKPKPKVERETRRLFRRTAF